MVRPERTVAARLTVRVPVNAAGTLVDGALRVVERIETVERVDSPEVRGLEPGLNDTVVDLHVAVTFDVGDRGEDVAVVRRDLETAVGIAAVGDLETVDPEVATESRARAG